MPQQKPKTFNNALSRRIISTPGPAAKKTFFYMQETGCLKTEDAAVTHRQDLVVISDRCSRGRTRRTNHRQ